MISSLKVAIFGRSDAASSHNRRTLVSIKSVVYEPASSIMTIVYKKGAK
ncbi:MAG: hypothetical protein ACJZ9G_02785 [Rhodospirillales bacterium]